LRRGRRWLVVARGRVRRGRLIVTGRGVRRGRLVVPRGRSVTGLRLAVAGLRLAVAGLRLAVAGLRLAVAARRLAVAARRLAVPRLRLAVGLLRLAVRLLTVLLLLAELLAPAGLSKRAASARTESHRSAIGARAKPEDVIEDERQQDRPTAKPPPCPKLFDISKATMQTMTSSASEPTRGMKTRRMNASHHVGLPTTFRMM
jgi:hypothetical protein